MNASLKPLIASLFGFAAAFYSIPSIPSASIPNLLMNPSFEEGREPWSWRSNNPSWHDFEITDQRAHGGRHSVHLGLKNEAGLASPRIWGIVQEIDPRRIPGKLDLWYRVEYWRQAAKKQYIQVIVMFENEKTIPGTQDSTLQLRYILGGMDQPPYSGVRNAKYVMAGPPIPEEGKWIHFETDVGRDFVKNWGNIPGEFTKIELFFEARYDDSVAADAVTGGDVYWDDLSLEEFTSVPSPNP